MTIEQRIERIEKDNRLLKWAMTALCVMAVGALVAGQTAIEAIPDVIRAKKIEVVDRNGRPVITLVAGLEGGTCMLWRTDGSKAASLRANATGGGLTLANRKGKNILNAGATESEQGGILQILNQESAIGLALGAAKDGGSLLLGNGPEHPFLFASRDERGGYLALADLDGLRTIGMQTTPAGGFVWVANKRGKFVAGMSAYPHGGQVETLDNAGKKTWVSPSQSRGR